ncbi:hypothetical protein [Sphingomonas echinoides]|jgi:hypothetical protein|uniref:hypothetical protein n=1 Tax=Sphingomonas echinoides TaxID=59803 RepID=UPI003EEF8167
MASLAESHRIVVKDDRFFFITSLIMAAIVVAGFSLMIVTGRSSFGSPPIVHAHAVVFMGWVVLYVTQNALVARGSIALHRRLGWIAAGWVVAMIVLGTVVTVRVIRLGHTPFFFPPALFLVLNPVMILTFAGLIGAAIVRRRQTEWHRRLNFSGMALLLGPAYGRLLPMPFLIPYAYEVDTLAVLILPVMAPFIRPGGGVSRRSSDRRCSPKQSPTVRWVRPCTAWQRKDRRARRLHRLPIRHSRSLDRAAARVHVQRANAGAW